MSDPVLHLLAGPNGAGKSTLFERVIEPVTRLPFVNADRIAARRWPGSESEHAYNASAAAAAEREEFLAARRSFVTETVFSHPSKVELMSAAASAGYLVTMHVVMIPAELAVLRVRARVARGGHDVPPDKIVERWERLWRHVVAAAAHADEVVVYDNSVARRPFRVVAQIRHGRSVAVPDWPRWTHPDIRALTE